MTVEPRGARVESVARAILRGWLWLKIAVWAVFLPSFGVLCLLHHLVGAALLLAIMGIALSYWALRPLAAASESRTIRGFAVSSPLLHVALAVLSLVSLLLPLEGGWEKIEAAATLSDPVLTRTEDGVIVIEGGGPDKTTLWSDDGGETWVDRGMPGLLGWYLAHDPQRDWLWVGASAGPVTMYDRITERWLQLDKPEGQVRALAVHDGRVFISVDGRLLYTDDEVDDWVPLSVLRRCDGLASAPGATGLLLATGDRWLASRDGGDTWEELPQPAGAAEVLRFPGAAIGGGDIRYVWDGGMLQGGLAVAVGDAPFELRSLPQSDVRTLVADPVDGRHVWIGTWGQGVYRSTDAGERWEDMGLQKIQAGSLTVDFTRRRAFVGSRNLAFDRGVYLRSF